MASFAAWLTSFKEKLAPLHQPKRQPSSNRWNFRPQLEELEPRHVPSAGAMISGVAFFDASGTGARTSQDGTVSNATIVLTGTTSTGSAVDESTTTDAGGFYSFLNLDPGTYQLNTSQSSLLTNQSTVPLTLTDGQVVNQDIAFVGYSSTGLTLRMLFASATGPVLNNQPFVLNPIQDVNVAAGTTTPTVINLAGNFSEPDMTDPVVTFTVSVPGDPNSPETIPIELFGKLAPQTVANFLTYVNSGQYKDSIFNRVQTGTGLVIDQGGGAILQGNVTGITGLTLDPPVTSEFGISNTAGTLAMALPGTPSDPNGGTSQFFFNVADNSAQLDPQTFTVFGKVTSNQAALTTINGVPNFNVTAAAPTFTPPAGVDFGNVPLGSAPTSNFPTDTTASDYVEITNTTVTPSAVTLTYSIVANSNPGLVTATLGNTLTPNDNNLLTLNFVSGQTGSAVITVQATSSNGLSVTTSFTVTVV